ncbi:MAG: hypothetical protein QOJ09_2546, partial [Actinomycetota bacterium]|nr:hypothetical protein [Actinomycetota bacterium]
MRARLTLILTIAAVCLAFVPMTPAHAGSAQEPASAWFSTSARSREQQVHAVAQLRHAERARLSAVAKALTTPPIVVAAPPVAPAPT